MDPRSEYVRRLEHRRSALKMEERRHKQIGILRLGVFVIAAVLGWFALFHSRTFSAWWLAAPAVSFVALVVMHSRVQARRRRLERAAAYYERGLSRIEGEWQGNGEQGRRFLNPHHPYAQDLDVFGEGSLFELLCATRTRAGEEKLASWLGCPAGAEDIAARQASVAELRPKLDLREELAVLGTEVRAGMHEDALAAWGSFPAVLKPGPTRTIAVILAALTLVSIAIWIAWGDHRWFLLMLLAEILFTFRMRRAIRRVVDAVEQPGQDLALFSLLLGRLEQETFRSQRLLELRSRLESDGQPPSCRIARLNRLIVLLDSRRNLLFAPVAAILLWETQFAYAIETWRRHNGPGIAGWIAAVAELEALSSLAGYAYEHPDDPFPEISESSVFSGRALGHPLIAENRCVRNDVHLGPDLNVLVVSGSNMSGKSTLLRTVGVNAVLALAGAPVRAASLRLSPLSLGASIRTVDSLQEGSSRFYAEITRLRQLVDLAEGSPPLLFLLDELLHGTNSHDRRIGAEAVVKGLLRRGAIGLLTTHDLALAKIADDLAPRAANVHFQDHIENGRIHFDYRLHPGVVEKSNALELMRSIGLEV